jgi:hypothetical protein
MQRWCCKFWSQSYGRELQRQRRKNLQRQRRKNLQRQRRKKFQRQRRKKLQRQRRKNLQRQRRKKFQRQRRKKLQRHIRRFDYLSRSESVSPSASGSTAPAETSGGDGSSDATKLLVSPYTWERSYGFRNIFARKMAFLIQNKNLIVTLVSDTYANFFRSKIVENRINL